MAGRVPDDSVRNEDGLKLLPRALDEESLIHEILDVKQRRLPLMHLLLERLAEGRRSNALSLHDVVVEKSLHIVDAAQ